MPKSKEFVYTDNDSTDEEIKPPKRQKKEIEDKKGKASKKMPERESNKDEDTVWDLGNNRQISIRDFKGKLYVDIREMYYDKEANLKPGKKGICLSIAQWQKLLSVVDDVDKAVKSKS